MSSSSGPKSKSIREHAKILGNKVVSLTNLNAGLDRMSGREKGPYHNHASSATNLTKWSNPAKGNEAKGNLAQGNPAKGRPANTRASSLGVLSRRM